MDHVEFTNRRRSEFSSSLQADALDLAFPAACTVRVRPLERLRERWTFQSMPQDVNLAAYGKQFSGGWPSFRGQAPSVCKDDGRAPSANDDMRAPSARSHPKTFAEQCVAYAGRIFSWDFCWTACMYLLPVVTFRNRR